MLSRPVPKIIANSFLVVVLVHLIACATFAQWREVKLPRTDLTTPLVAVEWPDSATGYVFDMKGRYYKTTDEGNQWTANELPDLPSEYFHVRYADFRTADFGIVSFSPWETALQIDTLIYITTDGGSSWKKQLVNLINYSEWGASNPYYSRLRPLSMHSWFLHYMSNDYDSGVSMEVVEHSSDLGTTWRRISSDTLKLYDVSAMCYLLVDSMNQYRFYRNDGPDDTNSWVKMTTDGGAHWFRIKDTSNPLAEVYFRNFGFMGVHTVNDTGIAITMAPDDGLRIGQDYGIATKDIRYRNSKKGWVSFALPWEGAATLDIVHQQGIVYVLTANWQGPDPRHVDSTWVFDASTGRMDEYVCPVPFQWELFPSSRNVLWGLTLHNYRLSNTLYRFDRQLTGVSPQKRIGENIRMFLSPNPFFLGDHNPIRLQYALERRSRSVRIEIYDLAGRLVKVLDREDVEAGEHLESIDPGEWNGLCNSTLFYIRLRTDDAEGFAILSVTK